MNAFNISRAFKTAVERKWSKVYWLIDAHDTILQADYGDTSIKREFFPLAKETLQALTNRHDCCLILFTCSWKDDIDELITWLKSYDIHFDYVNENPEVVNSKLSNFEKKPYCNIILDDKAGFEGETDWFLVKRLIEEHKIL